MRIPALALLLVLSALPLSAQGTPETSAPSPDAGRTGLHFSVGLGPGSVSASCDVCTTDFFEDRLTGLSGVLQLGFFANPRLAVTGEFIGWLRNDDPVYRRVAGLALGVLAYPSERSGFFLKGTVGGLRAIGENDLLLVQTDAWMATTGIGYDVSVGENVGVTVYGNYVRSFGGLTWVNGLESDVVVTPNALQFGVALTVH